MCMMTTYRPNVQITTSSKKKQKTKKLENRSTFHDK